MATAMATAVASGPLPAPWWRAEHDWALVVGVVRFGWPGVPPIPPRGADTETSSLVDTTGGGGFDDGTSQGQGRGQGRGGLEVELVSQKDRMKMLHMAQDQIGNRKPEAWAGTEAGGFGGEGGRQSYTSGGGEAAMSKRSMAGCVPWPGVKRAGGCGCNLLWHLLLHVTELLRVRAIALAGRRGHAEQWVAAVEKGRRRKERRRMLEAAQDRERLQQLLVQSSSSLSSVQQQQQQQQQ